MADLYNDCIKSFIERDYSSFQIVIRVHCSKVDDETRNCDCDRCQG